MVPKLGSGRGGFGKAPPVGAVSARSPPGACHRPTDKGGTEAQRGWNTCPGQQAGPQNPPRGFKLSSEPGPLPVSPEPLAPHTQSRLHNVFHSAKD